MTTIVWKAPGVLACDSMASEGGVRYRGKIKFQLREKYAYAVTGGLAAGLKLVEWIDGGAPDDCPIDDRSVTAVCMDLKTGKAWTWCHEGVPLPIEDKMYATGSGRELALGALAMGASASEAVAVACEWDDGSGFGVQFVASRAAQRKGVCK